MKFTIRRETLFKPLQLVCGIVERQQTMPILAHILLNINQHQLTITGTDLEAELVAHLPIQKSEKEVTIAETTVPARKLLDICRVVPEDSILTVVQEGSRIIVKTEATRFTLSTLPAESFPNIIWEKEQSLAEFSIAQKDLRELFESTQFAIAQQEARQYLNGMLFEIKDSKLWAIASDSRRLAVNSVECSANPARVIIPRKGIIELLRLLNTSSEEVKVSISNNHIRVAWPNFIFTSKLIDSKYPDYNKTIPRNGDKKVLINTEEFRKALARVAVVANDVYYGVQISIKSNLLQLFTRNQEHEEAEEKIKNDYQGDPLIINFNINYLLDIFNNIKAENVIMTLKDGTSSAVIEENPITRNNLYLIMPLCI